MSCERTPEPYEMTPSEGLWFDVDFARRLPDGAAVASAVATIEAGEADVGTGAYAPAFEGTHARAFVSGVVLGADVVFRITVESDDDAPETYSHEFVIRPVTVHES